MLIQRQNLFGDTYDDYSTYLDFFYELCTARSEDCIAHGGNLSYTNQILNVFHKVSKAYFPYLETLREFALPQASTAVSVCLSSYANPIVQTYNAKLLLKCNPLMFHINQIDLLTLNGIKSIFKGMLSLAKILYASLCSMYIDRHTEFIVYDYVIRIY